MRGSIEGLAEFVIEHDPDDADGRSYVLDAVSRSCEDVSARARTRQKVESKPARSRRTFAWSPCGFLHGMLLLTVPEASREVGACQSKRIRALDWIALVNAHRLTTERAGDAVASKVGGLDYDVNTSCVPGPDALEVSPVGSRPDALEVSPVVGSNDPSVPVCVHSGQKPPAGLWELALRSTQALGRVVGLKSYSLPRPFLDEHDSVAIVDYPVQPWDCSHHKGGNPMTELKPRAPETNNTTTARRTAHTSTCQPSCPAGASSRRSDASRATLAKLVGAHVTLSPVGVRKRSDPTTWRSSAISTPASARGEKNRAAARRRATGKEGCARRKPAKRKLRREIRERGEERRERRRKKSRSFNVKALRTRLGASRNRLAKVLGSPQGRS